MPRRRHPEPDSATAVAALDGQIAEEDAVIAEIEAELRTHQTARAKLMEARRMLMRKLPSERTAFERAGRANVEAAKLALTTLGRSPRTKIAAKMAEIRGVASVNDGVVSYALKALEEDGSAKRLPGRDESGAVVFEPVRRRGAVSRPGRR